MSLASQSVSVLGQIWIHPANKGRRLRQVVHALRFHVRGRVFGRRTLTPIGSHSVMWAMVHQSDTSRVVYANPPEFKEMMYWTEVLRPGDLFVDVGANVGSHTLWAAEVGATVLAFEPHPDIRQCLQANIDLNSYQVEVRPEALSDSTGTVRMTTDLGPMNHVRPAADGLEVRTTTLDEVLDGRHARGVKIDVEGFERSVVTGGIQSLKNRRIDYLQIEWNEQSKCNFGESRAPLLALLHSVGYSVIRPGGGEVTADEGADVFAVAPGLDKRVNNAGLILLNLGSGPSGVPGWINIDRSPNIWLDRIGPLKRLLFRAGLLSEPQMVPWPRDIRRGDITKRLPFEARSVDGIYSSHALEHLYLSDARDVLRECARVLKQDAVLRLALPDAGEMARDLVAGLTAGKADVGARFNEALATYPVAAPKLARRLLAPLSSPPHRWQPTRDLVAGLLHQAGFASIVACDFRMGDLPALVDVEHRRESLFVEARVSGLPAEDHDTVASFAAVSVIQL